MNILFVTPEVTPFARAGGLGDVSHHLPRALAALDHKLWIITPKHRTTEDAGYQLTPWPKSIQVPIGWRERTAQLFSCRVEPNIEVIFVGCDDLYNRGGLYGNEYGDYEDNAERFIFFNRAVMETIRVMDLIPDVIHGHDWPSGLAPVYVKTLYKNLSNLNKTATVFTFHNLGSQGIFWHLDFPMTGLGWELFTPEGLEFHHQINMTKAGLVTADLISTVSRKYSQEVLTPEYGFGLEGVLKNRREETYAVPHGVDYQVWDPAIDPYLTANYSVESLQLKSKCREVLNDIFGLKPDDQPIMAMVSRLFDRKGMDLINTAMDRLLSLPMKMVFLGLGDERYHSFLTKMAAAHPERLGVKIAYEPALVHQIMAGADIFLMPSRYEPCGLEQMYSLKYGTIPVVRATGGLDDSVIDVEQSPDTGTGFKFHDYTSEALYLSLASATNLFKDQSAWTAMMRRGMGLDFSWYRAAIQYEAIYQLAIRKVNSRVGQI
ncbi:MAG: glycogen synthase [Deltaproteobacteria bacterium]|nr:glycogen synthase [Deltaproteobacteria bacterium]